MQNIDLELIRYSEQLKIRREGSFSTVFDPVRRLWVKAEPEELVRQTAIQCLIDDYGYRMKLLNVEKKILIDGLIRRFDLVAYTRTMKPFLLLECKAPSISIGDEVFFQVAQYNRFLGANYLWVTNGVVNICCQLNFQTGTFQFIDDIPAYPE